MNNEKKIKEYINKEGLDIEKIMKEYTKYIFKIIKNNNNFFSEEDIEEIASDVFLVIWNNRRKLDINRSIAPYIAGVTRILILKKKRDVKETTVNIEDFENYLYDTSIIDLEYMHIEENNIVMKELEKLKEEDRKIFTNYYFNSKSIKEIAQMLNIKEGKVKSRLFRIRKKLKVELERRGYSDENRKSV